MERSAKSAKSRQSDNKKIEGRGQTKRGRGADDDGWGGFVSCYGFIFCFFVVFFWYLCFVFVFTR